MNGLPFQFTVRASQLGELHGEEYARALEDRDNELENFLAARLGAGTWSSPMRLSTYYLWIDATGDLRIESTRPTSDLDGSVLGTQA